MNSVGFALRLYCSKGCTEKRSPLIPLEPSTPKPPPILHTPLFDAVAVAVDSQSPARFCILLFKWLQTYVDTRTNLCSVNAFGAIIPIILCLFVCGNFCCHHHFLAFFSDIPNSGWSIEWMCFCFGSVFKCAHITNQLHLIPLICNIKCFSYTDFLHFD